MPFDNGPGDQPAVDGGRGDTPVPGGSATAASGDEADAKSRWQRLIGRRKVLVAAAASVLAAAAALVDVAVGQRAAPHGKSTAGQPTAGPKLRVRQSITELQRQYEAGNRKPLEDLWRAWIGVQQLPPDDPRSFLNQAG